MKTILLLALILAAPLRAETPSAAKIKSILDEGLEVKIVLIADTSGSMGSPPRQGGKAKIQQARQALSEFVAALPASIELGLLAFEDCYVKWLVPLGKSSREDSVRQIQAITPGGRTPIQAALAEAEKALLPCIEKNPYSRCVIVLVTDGEETCATVSQVRRTAAKISKEMLELNVIGFDLDGTGGYLNGLGAQYFRADDYEGLRKGLATVEAELDVGK